MGSMISSITIEIRAIKANRIIRIKIKMDKVTFMA